MVTVMVTAKVEVIEREGDVEREVNLCESCSSKEKDKNVNYTDIFTLSPEQMRILFEQDASPKVVESAQDQPILEALNQIDSALVNLFTAVSDPSLEIDQENKVDMVMAVGAFMKRFYKFRESILKE
jgi:hypothetical protein